jgi:hypothetical protein
MKYPIDLIAQLFEFRKLLPKELQKNFWDLVKKIDDEADAQTIN